MEFICIGLDYNAADVTLRGKVALSESKYEAIYGKISMLPNIKGSIIISTCNRTEFYLHMEKAPDNVNGILTFIKNNFHLNDEEIEKFYHKENHEALLHIFRVASGIESMIVGEDQILNQVKEAQKRAIEKKAADAVLNRLFRDAITCAKEIKHKTAMSQNKLSIASIGVDIVSRELGDLKDKKALVIGVGEMAVLTIKGLYEKQIGTVYLANRTPERALPLKKEFPQLALEGFDERYTYLNEADIVVCATAAPHTVLEYEKFLTYWQGKQILMVDMAVPRDIDERIAQVDGVKVFDIDQFESIAEDNLERRKQLVTEAEGIIEEYIAKLNTWLEESRIYRLLSKIDAYVDENVPEQAEGLLHKLDCGEALNWEQAKDYGVQLAEKVLKKLVLKTKEMPKEQVRVFIEVFEKLLV